MNTKIIDLLGKVATAIALVVVAFVLKEQLVKTNSVFYSWNRGQAIQGCFEVSRNDGGLNQQTLNLCLQKKGLK